MSYEIVHGDMLATTAKEEPVFLHQCNCVSQHGKGLSHAMFRAYPYANTYAGRTDPSKRSIPGTIDVMQGPRTVINLYGQYYPGPAKYARDMPEDRLRFFHSGLDAIAALGLSSVAMPFGIGCGLAGGDWAQYDAIIDAFAKEHPDIRVRLYKV